MPSLATRAPCAYAAQMSKDVNAIAAMRRDLLVRIADMQCVIASANRTAACAAADLVESGMAAVMAAVAVFTHRAKSVAMVLLPPRGGFSSRACASSADDCGSSGTSSAVA
jgi:hypothetical protein